MSATFSQTTTLDFGVLGEQEVEVHYTYSSGRPGKMYLRNAMEILDIQTNPPAETEIIAVYLFGLDILSQLPDKSYDSLHDTIISNHSSEE